MSVFLIIAHHKVKYTSNYSTPQSKIYIGISNYSTSQSDTVSQIHIDIESVHQNSRGSQELYFSPETTHTYTCIHVIRVYVHAFDRMRGCTQPCTGKLYNIQLCPHSYFEGYHVRYKHTS